MQYETPPPSHKRDIKCPNAPRKNKNVKIVVTDLYLVQHCIFPDLSNININGTNFIHTQINWSNYEN